jgi:hypothetical protein
LDDFNRESKMTVDSALPQCFSCKQALGLKPGAFVGRRDTCHNCDSDIHVCYNCKHYDLKSYNECREPQAERVIEKDKSNFCDYFHLTGSMPDSQDTNKADALKNLDDLFKKKA